MALIYLVLFSLAVALEVLVISPESNFDEIAEPKRFNATFSSLDLARDFVRPYLYNIQRDVNVVLSPGTHLIDHTFTLSSRDSGQNGFRVNYQGTRNSVVSGGIRIQGWKQVAGASYWQASVPSLSGTRQLYVNQQRRTRATSPSLILGKISIATDGYVISNAALASWQHVEDIEFVYTAGVGVPGAPWTESRCGVQNITGQHVIMKEPCWTNGRSKQGSSQAINLPSAIENHLNLLAEPGQWFFDSRTKIMYYWPNPQEDINTAEIIAASVDTLFYGSNVKDVAISDLTFSYSTWLQPSTGEGFIEIQANWIITNSSKNIFAPGSVHFEAANGMIIKNCTFIHLGAQGLVLSGGSINNTIVGNYFTDISGSGIRIGDVNDPAAPDRENTVVSNSIWDVCREFHGGVGISAGYLQNSNFLHNEISNVPYTGLSLGWGWGQSTQAKGNSIAFNNIHDSMGLLEDGGNIYVNGNTQGGSTIHDNWLWNYPAKTTGNLYLDNGSNQWTCTNNLVLYTSDTANWLYLQFDSSDNSVFSNYYEPAKEVNGPSSNKVYGNSPVSDQNFPPACKAIMQAAGPESPYKRNLSHNLSFRRPASASSTYSPPYSPQMAVDGDPLTLWSAASNSGTAWFQVDLLQPFKISQIHIQTRYDMYDPSWSENFEIWASNNADMSKGHVILGSQGDFPTPFRGVWRLEVRDTTPYQYVAVVKSDGTSNLVIAEDRKSVV